jgi:hypothetical protein
MGFFAEFNTWLTTLLAGYIADNTALIARSLSSLGSNASSRSP